MCHLLAIHATKAVWGLWPCLLSTVTAGCRGWLCHKGHGAGRPATTKLPKLVPHTIFTNFMAVCSVNYFYFNETVGSLFQLFVSLTHGGTVTVWCGNSVNIRKADLHAACLPCVLSHLSKLNIGKNRSLYRRFDRGW